MPAAEKVRQPELIAMNVDLPSESTGMAVASDVGMFERLALDPNVSVDKLERLIGMQERVNAANAKAAFNAAFAKMQSELPEIDERGKILVKGTLRSTYAKLEDINAAIKPVLKAHGFAIRHRTEWPADKPQVIRIVGILCHADGHSEESIFEAKADASDYRTDIQSMGSTVSYGRRYTTIDLLDITTRGLDDDGGRPKAAKEPDAPVGYDDWLTDMQSAADEGWDAMAKAWDNSAVALRAHLTETAPATLKAMKAKAKSATAKAAQS